MSRSLMSTRSRERCSAELAPRVRRLLLACGLLVSVGFGSLTISSIAGGAPRSTPTLKVLSMSVSSTRLTALGGVVVVSVKSRGATECSITTHPAMAGSPAKGACSSGKFSGTFSIPFNAKKTSISYTITSEASHGSKSVHGPTNNVTVSGTSSALPTVWSGISTLSRSSGVPDAVSCATTESCVEVDADGAAVTFDGTWGEPENIDSYGLTGVSCPTTDLCMATDQDGRVLTWNGTVWSAPAFIDPGVELTGISCASSTWCVAIDVDGRAIVLSDGSWGLPASIDGQPLTSISCSSVSVCDAVDVSGSIVEWRDGWSAPESVSNTTLTGVSCSGPSYCVAVDDTGSAYIESLGVWSGPDQTTSPGLTGVSCLSDTSCFAASVDGNVVALIDGTWAPVTMVGSQVDQVTAISCLDGPFCIAVDASGLASVLLGSSWTSMIVDPSAAYVTGISCGGPDDCLATFADGDVETWSGSKWSDPTATGASSLDAISCVKAFCMAVGDGGQAAELNGAHWTKTVTTDSSKSLVAISCVSSTFCMAVDNSGDVVLWTGTWKPPKSVAQSKYRAFSGVSCARSNLCVLVSNYGTDWLYNGGTYSIGTSDVALHALTGVACASQSMCVLVDQDGGARLYSGHTTWTPLKLVDPNGYTAVACVNSAACVAVDSDGYYTLYFNGVWSAPRSTTLPAPVPIVAVSCSDQPVCVAVNASNQASVLTF